MQIKLKEIRELRSLSQDEMAKMLHVSRAAYSYYETGKRWPQVETLREMAQTLNISLDYLLGLAEYPRPLQELSPQEETNLELYRRMDERGRNTVDTIMVFEQMRFPYAGTDESER